MTFRSWTVHFMPLRCRHLIHMAMSWTMVRLLTHAFTCAHLAFDIIEICCVLYANIPIQIISLGSIACLVFLCHFKATSSQCSENGRRAPMLEDKLDIGPLLPTLSTNWTSMVSFNACKCTEFITEMLVRFDACNINSCDFKCLAKYLAWSGNNRNGDQVWIPY